MMATRARIILGAVAASVCLAGCDQLDQIAKRLERTENRTGADRYQVMKNERGQTLQLDRVTGHITVVRTPAAAGRSRDTSGTNAPPAAAADSTPRPEDPAVPEPASGAVADEPIPPAEESAPQAPDPVESLPSAACSAAGRTAGVELVVSTAAGAFLQPDSPLDPIATIPAGARVRGVSANGEWLLVRFDDRVWGERAAYLHCSNVAAPPSRQE